MGMKGVYIVGEGNSHVICHGGTHRPWAVGETRKEGS